MPAHKKGAKPQAPPPSVDPTTTAAPETDEAAVNAGKTEGRPTPSFPIVGIGASAGGLAAFEAFFAGMPTDADPGMAFVLVQHLAPDHKSILSELVRRYTRMKVYEVEVGMTVQPNCTNAFHAMENEKGILSVSLHRKEVPAKEIYESDVVPGDFIVNLQKKILGRLGYDVTATTDSRKALQQIQSRPDHFDLLVTDQTMPYLSGVELTKEVLKISPDMPIILATGYSSAVTEEGSLALGIRRYVKKPIDRATLTALVREVLDEGG